MKNFVLPILTVLLLPLQACATKYSAEPIQARVVDAETKQPLEDVNVVANWQLEGGLEGGTNLGQMMVMETVTDSAGQFSFPAWGPKAIPSGYPLEYQNARLKDMDPQLLLFKSGYKYLALYNRKTAEQMRGKGPSVRTSDWNGKTIEMRRFTGFKWNLEQYAGDLIHLNGFLEVVAILNPVELPRDHCKWKKIPLMILATYKQNEIFKAANITVPYWGLPLELYDRLLSDEKYYAEQGCGSVKGFLGGMRNGAQMANFFRTGTLMAYISWMGLYETWACCPYGQDFLDE
ncbi:peptidase associated/transthyretin-like domain-containing protein [Methylocaldum gracile]|jgi:hypothetical protein|nr:hypothetical protein [Methylocaldum sp. BRCS4]